MNRRNPKRNRSLGVTLAAGLTLGLGTAGNAPAQCGGDPWLTAAGEAESNATDLLFVPDSGYRIDGGANASPAVHPETGDVWLYYADGPDQYRAVSEDGLTFPAGETPTDWELDPRGTRLPDGTWRRYAYVPSVEAFRSHASEDGITYAPDDGTIHYSIQPEDENWVGVYTAFTNSNDEVTLIYLGAQPGTARRAISTDGGDTFIFDQANLLGDEEYKECKWVHWDPRALVLDDGRVRLFTMVQGPQAALPGSRAVGTVYSFISGDGTDEFTLEAGARLQPSDFSDLHLWSLHDPWVIELPDGRFRMYVAAKASDDSAGNNLRSVIVSATTLPMTAVPTLGTHGLAVHACAILLMSILVLRSHRRRALLIIACTCAMLGFSDAARANPGAYFTAIHCDPQYASDDDWNALVDLVAAADADDQKLTIQFNPLWATVLANNPESSELIEDWVSRGHEIGAHHHVLTHPGGWDGYTNEDEEDLPDPQPWPGYRGDMADFLAAVEAMLPEGIEVKTVSSKDYDFPVGANFQTGGSDSTAAPSDATSRPTAKELFGETVYQLDHAALIAAGSWQLPGMMSVFDAAPADVVFGAAVHPQDYYPDNHGPMDAWFAFLASRDPTGSSSQTAGAIMEEYLDSLAAVPAGSRTSLFTQVATLLALGALAIQCSLSRRRN